MIVGKLLDNNSARVVEPPRGTIEMYTQEGAGNTHAHSVVVEDAVWIIVNGVPYLRSWHAAWLAIEREGSSSGFLSIERR